MVTYVCFLFFCRQLVSIVDLYEPRYIRNHLVPLTLTLIKDKVCEVRLATVRVVSFFHVFLLIIFNKHMGKFSKLSRKLVSSASLH